MTMDVAADVVADVVADVAVVVAVDEVLADGDGCGVARR